MTILFHQIFHGTEKIKLIRIQSCSPPSMVRTTKEAKKELRSLLKTTPLVS